jgi:hypothetical protein
VIASERARRVSSTKDHFRKGATMFDNTRAYSGFAVDDVLRAREA